MSQLSYKDYLAELNYSEKDLDDNFSIDFKKVDDAINETLLEIERLEKSIEKKNNDIQKLQKQEKQFVSEIEKLIVDEKRMVEDKNQLVLAINDLLAKIKGKEKSEIEINSIQTSSVQIKKEITFKQQEIEKNSIHEKKLINEIEDLVQSINDAEKRKLLYTELIKLDEERKELKKVNANIQRNLSQKKNAITLFNSKEKELLKLLTKYFTFDEVNDIKKKLNTIEKLKEAKSILDKYTGKKLSAGYDTLIGILGFFLLGGISGLTEEIEKIGYWLMLLIPLSLIILLLLFRKNSIKKSIKKELESLLKI
ncbi:hypothetical protein [Maribellus maritimus]|uniref:hypothetical protein n=1 Tax=Maribellus maritimus TaxID=2870838 RepID=UPI001EE9E17B|nr:hypothetical protein [Maribellus maritimus]MCG6191405.1 hypothetical protein [Maribellus maritimus]